VSLEKRRNLEIVFERHFKRGKNLEIVSQQHYKKYFPYRESKNNKETGRRRKENTDSVNVLTI